MVLFISFWGGFGPRDDQLLLSKNTESEGGGKGLMMMMMRRRKERGMWDFEGGREKKRVWGLRKGRGNSTWD